MPVFHFSDFSVNMFTYFLRERIIRIWVFICVSSPGRIKLFGVKTFFFRNFNRVGVLCVCENLYTIGLGLRKKEGEKEKNELMKRKKRKTN